MILKKIYRSFIVIFLFGFFGCGALILNFIIFPYISLFEKKENKRKVYCNIVHKSWKFFCDMIEKFGIIKINFENIEELKKLKSKIIVANHPSFIDIVILVGYLPNTICVAKKELRKNFFMGNIVKSLFLINDEDKDNLIKETTKLLNENFNIIVFPTGTRTETNKESKLYKGAATIALHTQTEIIPVFINCDSKFLAKNQCFCDAGENTVNYYFHINPTIKTIDYIKENLTNIQIRNRINSAIKENITKLTLPQ